MIQVDQNKRISIEEVIKSSFFDSVRNFKKAPVLDEMH
jgi:hypothetical protein